MERDIGPERHAAHDRTPDVELVEQGHHLARVGVHAVLRGMVRFVARAVPEQVEEYDAEPVRGEAAGQLPVHAGIEQQPVREDDHALAVAVYLVAEDVSLIAKPAERHTRPL
jgi:hypothetical protein